MDRPIVRIGIAVGIALLALAALGMGPLTPTRAPLPPPPDIGGKGEGDGGLPICFWSDQGPVCVERTVEVGATGLSPEGLMAALLAGPTLDEQAQGLWSAIPEGTKLERVETRPGGTVVVYLRVPPEGLRRLNHGDFEVIVEQVGWTLEPLNWRDLRIQTWDPTAENFVPLADFLPEIPAPRKETVLTEEEGPAIAPAHAGQPPAPGQGQPQGALTGKTIYVSAGHGWKWSGYDWRVQRPPYPNPPYVGPIIEDHNNAEAVNQYLLQYLWNAGAMVWPVRERDMNTAEVIVDNDAPITGTGYFETGVWTTTTASGTGYEGTDYRWATTVTGTPTATAVWTATLPADGRYAVYVWYRSSPDPSTSNRAPDARYTVRHAGGETTVTIDQRRHGLTWHYIGTYGFRAGEEARVALDNQSSVAGLAVIADAVRFGGGTFDDLTGIETSATYAPDKPWWEVAAFYYTQKMGAPQPPGDVTARPIYARWEHADTGDDAVYVSWHTNGISGYQWDLRGTMSIIHNGEGKAITPGSAALRDAIHDELVHDIRAGWDPTWPGSKRSMNLGELRELWDTDPAVRMPGALIEVAYHDHPDDTDALKEPTFEMLAARAIYQGVLRYFDPNGVELPEPPTHLMVENVSGGQVRVSWQPSPTDTVGLVGDAATGYQVYTSTDGIGWSNGVPVIGTTVYTLTGLSPGQLLFVRVTATNDGGESFPTETLGARVGGGAEVLLVNDFDRLDRYMLLPDYDPVEGYNMRMFLDQMNSYDYVIQHGEVISYPFDSASNEAVSDTLVHLGDYALVDWIVGEQSSLDGTLDANEQASLMAFLSGGGALFISGPEIGWDLYEKGSVDDQAFYNGYLRADYVDDDAGTYEVAPASGFVFEGLGPFRFDAAGMYDADYPDRITPISGSVAALTYQGGSGGTAAVQYAHDCERLVYFAFPFETIWPEQRSAVMARVLDFLDLCIGPSVDTKIITPTDGSAYNVKPDFQGTAETGTAALSKVEVQIQNASTSQYWTETGWDGAETWLTASGTDVWSYTLPALDQSAYHLRARAWTTDGYSDTTPAEITFIYDTVVPTATTLITPTGGITIPAVLGAALEWQSVGPDGGSDLAYLVELDGQFYTTTQSVYTVTAIADGPHTWGVQVFDAAGNRSGWVTDTFSVSRLYRWLPLVMHGFGEPVALCDDVIVNGDFESDEGWTLNQLAVYSTDQVYSGARSARVGIPPGEPGGGALRYSSVMQEVTLPISTSATLRLWVYPISEGNDSGDLHYVWLVDQFSSYNLLDGTTTNGQAWVQREYDLSAYLGQTVTLYIGVKNDGDDDTAALYVDDVVLEVCP